MNKMRKNSNVRKCKPHFVFFCSFINLYFVYEWGFSRFCLYNG